jgi:hypothetical protein
LRRAGGGGIVVLFGCFNHLSSPSRMCRAVVVDVWGRGLWLQQSGR